MVAAAIIVLFALREGVVGAASGNALAFVVAALELAVAGILVARPKWSFWAALALTLQQMATYGLRLAVSFNGTAPLDKMAIVICLFFPTLVTVLYLERQEEAERDASEA